MLWLTESPLTLEQEVLISPHVVISVPMSLQDGIFGVKNV